MRLVAVILPYAVSIRDLVHTGVLSELLRVPGLHIHIYTQNAALPEFDAIRSKRVTLMEILPHAEGRLERLLKKLYPILFYDVFVYIQQNVDQSWRRRLVARLLVLWRRLLGTRRALRFYGWLLRRVSTRRDEHLIAGTPDLVISTRSLVNSLDYPLILEAAERGLPQLALASSWDNFTTKGFFPFPVERTVVWNRQMARELAEIFEVDPERIVRAGYPRLKLLRDTGAFDNAGAYLLSLGLGQYRRFVLHTASYAELTRTRPGMAPEEYRMIRDVAVALVDTLPADTCILVRLHPYSQAEDEGIFSGLERVHVFVPGRQDCYVERVMSEADEVHLAAQLSFSECIVSMASTITIDALALGRPIINVRFDPAGPEGSTGIIRRFYGYNHFRDLVAQVQPPIANDVRDVIAFVRRCMAGDREPGADLAAFERFYVPHDSDAYPEVVRRTVQGLLDASVGAESGGR
jgi:hypothetical protein